MQATPPPAARATSGSLGASPSGPPKPPRPPGGYPGSGSRWKTWDAGDVFFCFEDLGVFILWFVFNGKVCGQIVFWDGFASLASPGRASLGGYPDGNEKSPMRCLDEKKWG